ncbi:MAG: hypothetical protein JWQ40_4527 [Segetibacter sp.]|nr:hypothetical protein [Segetibacter sp.]
MRKAFIVVWLVSIFVGIVTLFWQNQLKYTLPTPVPDNYQPVAVGKTIGFKSKLVQNGKPVFLHFFNPDCPCSRFNISHFKSLVDQYKDQVNFAIVVMSKETIYKEKEIQDRFDVEIPVLFDDSIASSCGVYSTPQAVILKPDNKLYYRGNYNRSRYCTDKKSEYAKLALNSLLNKKMNIGFSDYAVKAYGCELPNCLKNSRN